MHFSPHEKLSNGDLCGGSGRIPSLVAKGVTEERSEAAPNKTHRHLLHHPLCQTLQ